MQGRVTNPRGAEAAGCGARNQPAADGGRRRPPLRAAGDAARRLHEVFADSLVNAGAALGFALAQARRFIEPARPGLLILQLKADAQELGLPYGLGLKSFGLDTEAIVLIRTDTIVELLWAMEEAIACRAVAAVVADIAYPHKALDFTASRRLACAPQHPARRCSSSATRATAKRAPHGSAGGSCRELSRPPPFDDRAPGPPRWRVTLEKGSLGKRRKASAEGEVFLVDWTENGFVLADAKPQRSSPALTDVAALSGAAPAALGDRLSEAG